MKNNNYKQTEIGEIPEDWEIKRLGDILAEKGYIRGPFGSSLLRSELKPEGVPVYEQQHVIDSHRNFRYFIDNAKLLELSRFTVKENDLLISCSGTLGKVSIITKDDPIGIISQALLILRPDIQKILPHLLRYFFTSNLGFGSLASLSSGSVQVNLAKREIIENLVLPLPPIDEQAEIVRVLTTIDDKIELNKKTDKILGEIGKALFKRWFVDFEFPNDDGKPYKSSGGEMADSEIGEIPEGWEIGCLPDVAKIQKGLSYSGKDLAESGSCALVGLKCFERKGGFRIDGIKYYNGKFKNDHLIETGDLVVAMTDLTQGAEVIGNPALVPFIPNIEMAVASLDVSILKPTSSLSREYLYLLLNRQESQDFLYGYTNGSTVLHLSIKGLYEFKLLVPSPKLIDMFNILVENIFFLTRKNQHENINLTALRNSLLPRLINGKLRVN